MGNTILLCLAAALLMGCASLDETVTQTASDAPNTDVQAPVQKVTISSALAHQLYLKGDYSAAFDMNYELATRGDDRSQYNLGVSYYNGIEGKITRNYVEAYAWMLTSQRKIQEADRMVGLDAVKAKLSKEKQLVAAQRADVLFAQHGSGTRVENNLEVVISALEHTKRSKKACSRLGSRLKRDCHGAQQFDGKSDLYKSPITKFSGG